MKMDIKIQDRKVQSHLQQMYEMLPQLHCEVANIDCIKSRKVEGKALIKKILRNISLNRLQLGLSKMTFDEEGYAEHDDDCMKGNIGYAKCDASWQLQMQSSSHFAYPMLPFMQSSSCSA